MAKQHEGVKRTVLVAVDGSEHSERAFDCEYFRAYVTIRTRTHKLHRIEHCHIA